MKFKQIQALKHKAYEAFIHETNLDVPVCELHMLDSISLAFVGDAYYALYIRRRLVDTGVLNVQVLHVLAAELVSAKAQAYVYCRLKEELNETEASVCRRARNAYSQVPKSATAGEYHNSTALEALIGYLVLAADQDRLNYIMQQVYEYTREYCKAVHEVRSKS